MAGNMSHNTNKDCQSVSHIGVITHQIFRPVAIRVWALIGLARGIYRQREHRGQGVGDGGKGWGTGARGGGRGQGVGDGGKGWGTGARGGGRG